MIIIVGEVARFLAISGGGVMSVKVYLTGRVVLEVDGQVVVNERGLRGRQGRVAFAYLVCNRTRPVPREELVKAVWPSEMAPAWEAPISSLMSRIRNLLSTDLLNERDVSISSDFGQYQLQLPSNVWVDLEAGASAIDHAESAIRAGASGGI
jgi:DNA-binding SARP family transcriptional activator